MMERDPLREREAYLRKLRMKYSHELTMAKTRERVARTRLNNATTNRLAAQAELDGIERELAALQEGKEKGRAPEDPAQTPTR